MIFSISLRVFNDPSTDQMWKASVKDIDGDVLCVSQFTLMANTTKGNKPDFHRAMASSLRFSQMGRQSSHSTSQQSLLGNYTPHFLMPLDHITNPTKFVVRTLFLSSSPDYCNWKPPLDGRFGEMMSVSLTNEVKQPLPCNWLWFNLLLIGTSYLHHRLAKIWVYRPSKQ